MDAKDFIALNDQMIAFNALMSGKLKDEVEAASKAIELLGGAKTIMADRSKLEDDKVSFDNYRKMTEKSLQDERDKINAANTELSAAQDDHAQTVAAHADSVASLLAEKSQWASDKAQMLADIESLKAVVVADQAKIEAQRVELNDAQKAIDAREAEVADKLAKLKSIV